jgi:hypothetical protein
MDMENFFSETNIASVRHLALPGITATDRKALFRVLSKRFINAQNSAKHRRLAFARRQSQSDSRVLAKDEGKRQMENLGQLHFELDRTQFRLGGWLSAMRFRIDFPRLTTFRPGVLFGLGDVGRIHRPPHPVIVTEQHADPVELVFQAFLRLDREQRARLAQRLKWRLDGAGKPARLKGPR